MTSKELIFTKPCFHCGMTGMLLVDAKSALNWANGMLIQDAFPDLAVPLREQIITGTHPECWDKVFNKTEEQSKEDAEKEYFEELWAESQRFEARYNSENYI